MVRSKRAKPAIVAEPSLAQQSAGIQQLSDDLLGRVLLLVPQGQRLRSAEVCKAWNRLLRRADMWAVMKCPIKQLASRLSSPHGSSIGVDALHWITTRCPATKVLRVEGTDLQRNDSVDVELQKLLLAFAAAPALAELSVLLPDHATMSCDSLYHVKLLGGLTKLEVQGISLPMTTNAFNGLFSALPKLQACKLDMNSDTDGPKQIGVPTALYGCSQLTSFVIYDHHGNLCMDWGGLSQGITALQRLAHLRLQNVLSEPLTCAVSTLTSLTSLGLYSDHHEALSSTLLPAAAAALTELKQLDVDGHVPSALAALAGLHDLTLRAMDITLAHLAKLSGMLHLSRLRLCDVTGDFEHGEVLKGLDGCTALQQLRLSGCGVEQLSACRALRQLTELRMQWDGVGMSILTFVAEAMPQLVTLDLSVINLGTMVVPSELIEALRSCISLRHLWCRPRKGLPHHVTDDLMEVQRAVPRVHWHLRRPPGDEFQDD